MSADPFAMAPYGGSQRTVTPHAAICSDATTAPGKAAARRPSSSDPVTRSSCEMQPDQPSLFGACPDTGETVKPALSARYFVTKARTSRQSLSDKLTPSLITAGLVCGITPSSIRQQSGQPIRALAFAMPDGGALALPRLGSLSLSDERPSTTVKGEGE